MSYRAKVIKVMIASPSDVAAERQIIRNVIQEWNNAHSEDKNLVLMPVGWELHSTPAIGGRPQALINKQVLADCDLLIAVFWTKVGTPTGKAVSGTVEEIEEHVKAKKPAMVYFSLVPVVPGSVNPEQLNALQEFKGQLQERGLYAEYDSTVAFREALTRQLAQVVNRHFASKKNGHVEESSHDGIAMPKIPSLSQAAKVLLLEASQSERGSIFRSRTMHGLMLQIGDRNLADNQDARTTARWEGALKELCRHALIQQQGHLFAVTDEGYRIADLLREQQLVPM